MEMCALWVGIVEMRGVYEKWITGSGFECGCRIREFDKRSDVVGVCCSELPCGWWVKLYIVWDIRLVSKEESVECLGKRNMQRTTADICYTLLLPVIIVIIINIS